MARTTKKETVLSPEEKLAKALVPKEEQPYKVPENWCWVTHNSILDISGGAQPDKSHFISEQREGYTQLYQTRDYGEHPVPVYIPDRYATKTTDAGDILLARYGGSLGKVFRARKGAYNVALAKVIRLYPSILNDEFLYQYYLSHFYQEFCIKAASGRSAQAGFNRNDMEELLFPLPPIAEQQRIVARIESLFTKLDEAKEKAQATVDGFEDRRTMILHKAFIGELTADWRLANPTEATPWEVLPLHAVCHSIKAGGDKPSDFVKKKDLCHSIPVVANGIDDDGIIGYTAEYKNAGNAVTVSGRGTIGYSICRDYPFYPVVRLLVLEPNHKMTPKFLKYVFDAFPEEGTGTSIPQLTVPMIKDKRVPCPSFIEQKQIIDILENVLYQMTQAKETAERVIDQIDAMKKSILARAFRGELGTNDPDDEPAIELLKRVLSGK